MTKKAPDETVSGQMAPVPARPAATPKGAGTRARIIKGALETLETHGIGAVTTRKIASTAGVQLATLHYHFDSKETLLIAVLEDLVADMVATYRREIEPGGDPDERLEALLRSIWRYVERTRDKQIAQIELTLYALRTKGSEWLASTQYEAYLKVYRELIPNGDGGDGRGGDEAEALRLALGRFVLGGIDGLILQTFSLNDEAAAKAGLEALITASKDYRHRLSEMAGTHA